MYWKNHYGSIVFASLGIVAIPQLFFHANSKEFDGDLVLIAIPVVAALAVLAVLRLLSGKSNTNQRIQCVLTGTGVAILLCDMLFRANLGALDGGTEDFSASFTTKLGSLAVFFGLPTITGLFADKVAKLMKDLAPIASLLAVGLVGYSVVLAYSAHDLPEAEYKTNTQDSANPLTPSAGTTLPNIYLIWLDGLQADYSKRYLDSAENSAAFPGFTMFAKNSSNYLYTLQSYASFMSGTLYRKGHYETWAKGGERLRQTLAGLNYRISAYAKTEFLSELDVAQTEASQIFSERNAVAHPYVADFVTYWLTRSLPAAVTQPAFKLSRTAGNKLHQLINPNQHYAQVQSIADGIEPLSGVFTLEKLLADEAARSSFGELVIAQAVIPHGPYVIDNECNYRGRGTISPQDGYYQQLECAMHLTGEFLEELKRLNRYESSLVIIFGDHGSGWAGLIGTPPKQETAALNPEYTTWTSSMVAGRAAAGLLIKPNGTSTDTPLIRSGDETQLMDIYPTILTLLGESEQIDADVEGHSLFTQDGTARPTPPREKFMTYFRPSKMLNLREAEIYDLSITEQDSLEVSLRGPFQTAADFPSMQCGKPISFANNYPDTDFYSSFGLSSIWGWGRWSVGNRVSLEFRAPDSSCAQNTLVLTARGFVSTAHPIQKATVELNGQHIGDIEYALSHPDKRVHKLNLPAGALQAGQLNSLEFNILTAQSPKALGLSIDDRLLGIGFEALQVN